MRDMAILNEKTTEQLKKDFESLKDEVNLIFFKESSEKCEHCKDTEDMLEEIAAISRKIKVSVFDIDLQKTEASKYKIDKTPAIAILDSAKRDCGIRFFGIPAGHEFSSFIETLKMVSSGESGLLAKSKEILKKISKPIDIKVFVTLTCPYCPPVVKLANKFAYESENISSQMLVASEFMELAMKYDVRTVPKIIINEKEILEGAKSEKEFLKIIERVSK